MCQWAGIDGNWMEEGIMCQWAGIDGNWKEEGIMCIGIQSVECDDDDVT